MENLSASARILPGLSGNPASAGGGFDMSSVPGFDVVQKLFLRFGMDPSLLVTIGMSLTLLTSVLSFVTYSFGSLTTLTRFISANLVSSATIHSSDVTYLYIMRWLAMKRVSTDCRLFCVTSRKNPQSHAVRRYSSYTPYGDGSPRPDDEDEDAEEEGGSEDDRLGPKLKYTPAPGFLCFLFRKNLVILNRKLDLSYYTGDIPDETLTLTTIGRSPVLLRELLSEARKDYLLSQSRKTMVYTLSPTPFAQKTWDQGRHRPSRDISTVIMPHEPKEFLLRDVKEYLDPVTARWYAQRGLPYRRGYLFYGPPGTGKTSLSLALAGELKVPLYILSLSTGSLTDETLTMLFLALPKKCIVLLEDIDCAGVQRTGGQLNSHASDSETSGDSDAASDDELPQSPRGSGYSGKTKRSIKASGKPQPKKSKGGPRDTSASMQRQPRTSVSFSGLLNAIDGVASHEGRILIMTTNHKERLDPALIRPGRVDVQIEFGYAGNETLEEIFRELYSRVEGIEEQEKLFGGEDVPFLAGEKGRKATPEEYRKKIEGMAQTFAKNIPEGVYTPAEVQGYLMSYKRKPSEALQKLDAWLQQKRNKQKPKERKRRGKAMIGVPPPKPTIQTRFLRGSSASEKVSEMLSSLSQSPREEISAMIDGLQQIRDSSHALPTIKDDSGIDEASVGNRGSFSSFCSEIPGEASNGHAI